MRTPAGLALAGLLLFGLVPGAAAQHAGPSLPVRVAAEQWHPLRETVDTALQARLVSQIAARPDWQQLVSAGRMAVGLVDMTDPARPRFAAVNGNRMIYAASLPKIAILLAAEQAIRDGMIELTDDVEADLNAMIRTSSNVAATAVIDRMGLAYIDSVLTDPRYELYDEEYGGGLWVGKRYAKAGPRIPDPIAGLSHGATVSQVCRFYYLLATGRLVSPERSRHMLDVMVDPGINHKFVAALNERAPQATLFRKSGSWQTWHADSVMVWGDGWRRYILVSLVEDASGERILRELVPAVEEVLRGRAQAR